MSKSIFPVIALSVFLIRCTPKEFSGQATNEIRPQEDIDFLRTPEERFKEVKDYPFADHYTMVGGNLRMHYIDVNNEGENPVIVLLHGEPTWSYLYRKMIPLFVEAGYRVIAPDMIGFGKSDKPVSEQDHTYLRHVEWMRTLLFDSLGLQHIHLYAQDWGGMVGLRLVAEHPGRFLTVIVSNTGLPTGEEIPSEAFLSFQEYSQTEQDIPVGELVQHATDNLLKESEKAAYDAPFPDASYKAGVRALPLLVPTNADDPASQANRQAWEVLKHFNKPFLTLFGNDPVTIGFRHSLMEKIPGARKQPHALLPGGHFIQEEQGEEIALRIISFIANAHQ